jgi:hypothetical protein
MIQKKYPPAGDPRLWLQMRFLESSLRFGGDAQLALTDEMIKIDPDAGNKGYATTMKGFPPQPWPCIPPSPCIKSLADLEEFIKLVEKVAKEVVRGFGAQLMDARKLGIDEIIFRIRENPGYPHGSMPPDGGGAAPPPAMRKTAVGSSRK